MASSTDKSTVANLTKQLPIASRLVSITEVKKMLSDQVPLLGVVDYGGVSSELPFGTVPVISVELPQLDSNPLIEIWTSDSPATYGQNSGISFAKNDQVLFGCISVEYGNSLEATTYSTYKNLLSFLTNSDYPHLLRMWNYFPAIHQEDDGLDRYKQFCIGRAKAFTEHHLSPTNRYPAATVIGTIGGQLIVYFIASHEPGLQSENPRQVSAYRYPEQYGPTSPSFSRAILKRWQNGQQLYISGTASIVGHASQHQNELANQLKEIFNNLNSLLEHVRVTYGLEAGLNSISPLKVYIRNPSQLNEIKNRIKQIIDSEKHILYLQGNICRSDLLLEIEGLLSVCFDQ